MKVLVLLLAFLLAGEGEAHEQWITPPQCGCGGLADDSGIDGGGSAEPTSVPPTVAPLRVARYTPEELRPLLEIYDWPVDEALLVVYGPTSGCPNGESTGYPTVTSRYGHRGLFQLYDGHIQRFERRGWTWDDAYVAERNIAIAYELWAETRDWRHWSCAPD